MQARGKFRVEISQNHITVSSGDKEQLTCAPAEAAILRKLVSFAVDVSMFKAVPEKVATAPFVVFFQEDGTCVARRQTELSGGCTFTPEEGEDLVRSIDLAVDILVDNVKISGPRKSVSPMEGPDPVIEGR
jgi:hypothetical protein